MNEGKSFELLDILTVMSLCLQIQDHNRDMKQLSNDDLMKELQKQDREYLERIIENQREILKELTNIREKLAYLG